MNSSKKIIKKNIPKTSAPLKSTEMGNLREIQLRQQVEELQKTKKAMVNLLEDIQDEKNRSQSLAKDLEKFKLAVESASDLITLTDPDGYILYANKALNTITGFIAEEVIGKKPGELWGGAMEKAFYAKMWERIKKEKKVFVGECNNHRKNGEKYIGEVQIVPILNEKKKVIFFLGVERDITRMKEIDRMKSEFISVASHQLRTPLTGIKWFAELLLHDKAGVLSKDQRDFMQQIYESNERMIKLVNDLLNVSHIESGTKFILNKKQIDIVPLIRTVVEEERILAKDKNIKIIVKNLKGKCFIMADAEKFQEVIENLIGNAIKYSFPQSAIIVDLKKNTGKALLSITDQGIGISLDQQSRIFEKFFRAKNITAMETDGNGLGLYIAKAIIEAHGGKIWFESKEKKGTTFYCALQLSDANPVS